jgi:septal ring factor EnvC (AmiA/AmiB activator)
MGKGLMKTNIQVRMRTKVSSLRQALKDVQRIAQSALDGDAQLPRQMECVSASSDLEHELNHHEQKVKKLKKLASSQEKKISELKSNNKSLQGELECIRSDKKGPLQKLLVLHTGITNEQKDKISNQEAEISQQEERKRGLLTEIECLKRRIKDAGRT